MLHVKPSLLVSYFYLDKFDKCKPLYNYDSWAMDSGAFSGMNAGVNINLIEYTKLCKARLEEDSTLKEVFALDVIGDWKQSLRNTQVMWRYGVEAIPTFHYGSPWDVLVGLAKDYPKIALGGCVGKKDRDTFAKQCFARVYPKRIHGFGFGSDKSMMSVPFHTVDCSTWEIAPCRHGRWNSFKGYLSVRGATQNLRPEIEWYMELQEKARIRWVNEMQKLYEVRGTHPIIRLVVGSGRSVDPKHVKKNFGV